MLRHRFQAPNRLLAAAFSCYMLLASTHAANLIAGKPSGFTLLAESMVNADESTRWAFADAMLEVLMETYEDELRNAATDSIRNQKRRAKLDRWQRATRRLVEGLYQARLRLSEGAEAIIQVDAQRQVLLFVDRDVVAFTPARPGSERALEARVVDRYCAFHDCDVVGVGDAMSTDTVAASGVWSLGGHRSPAYVIDGRVRCEFTDLVERLRKQQVCTAASVEAQLLDDTLLQSARDGFAVDWQHFTLRRSADGSEAIIRVNGNGDYLRLPITHLTNIDRRDWRTLKRWLRRRQQGGRHNAALLLAHGDRLLANGLN